MVLAMAWAMVFVTGEQKDLGKIDRKSAFFLLLSGITTGLSWLCYYRALQDELASVVVPIDKLSILVTIVFSGLVLKGAQLQGGMGLVCSILAGTEPCCYRGTKKGCSPKKRAPLPPSFSAPTGDFPLRGRPSGWPAESALSLHSPLTASSAREEALSLCTPDPVDVPGKISPCKQLCQNKLFQSGDCAGKEPHLFLKVSVRDKYW